MLTQNPKISIVFPSYNGVKFLKKNLDSIKNLHDSSEIQLIIIDNMSRDASVNVIKSYVNKINLKLIRNSLNEGFAEACNSGVKHSEGEFIFITNQDVIFPPDFFIKLLQIYNDFKKNNEIIISPALVFEDGRIHYFGATNHFLGFSFTPELGEKLPKKRIIKKTQRFSGGSLFIKKNLFLNMGGFDKDFFMYHEDTDLSLRLLRNKIEIITTNDPFLIHQKKNYHINKFQFFFLERNRFFVLAKNINNIHKIIPILLILEFILLIHSLFIKKFKIRLKIYIDLVRKSKYFKIMRKKSKSETQLLSYQILSRKLNPILLGKLQNIKAFRSLLKIMNRFLSIM